MGIPQKCPTGMAFRESSRISKTVLRMNGRISPFEVKQYFLNTCACYGPVITPSFTHTTNSLSPGERSVSQYYYYAHFRDEEPEVQRG